MRMQSRGGNCIWWWVGLIFEKGIVGKRTRKDTCVKRWKVTRTQATYHTWTKSFVSKQLWRTKHALMYNMRLNSAPALGRKSVVLCGWAKIEQHQVSVPWLIVQFQGHGKKVCSAQWLLRTTCQETRYSWGTKWLLKNNKLKNITEFGLFDKLPLILSHEQTPFCYCNNIEPPYLFQVHSWAQEVAQLSSWCPHSSSECSPSHTCWWARSGSLESARCGWKMDPC